ncbi:sulfite exporter TauE/SafE family protein [Streptomyces sp. NPDC057245]|uniref:urease accessory protein UreH domain-containing protein n=1 Tax=Streptomyces sp. NPDC057245 TaxID=3346065 RepID=UPI00363EA05A
MTPRRLPGRGLPRRLLARGAAVLTAVCALVLLPSPGAGAHPLGNFTVNRYDGLVVAPGELRVDHVEDLAEIPATQAAPDVERLGAAEWARRRCEQAARDSRLTVGGRAVALAVRHGRAEVRPGQAGLDTLRLECRLTAPLPGSGAVTVGFRASGASSGPGWREITARGDRTTLTASDVPEESASHELTRYPQESLSSPADTASASLRAVPGGPALDRERQDTPAASVLPRGADRWTRALDSLVARHDLTLGFAALALVVSVALGAMHALAPGHGKTLMAATAAARGGGARLKDVLPMAASVTVTHTLGVIALGLLVTAGSAAAPSVVAWLGVVSGVLVALAGASLARRALRKAPHTRHAHDHPHAHPHPHPHPHPHDHSHSHQHTHSHSHPHPHPASPTLRGTILMGFAGGLVPSPSAVVVLVGAAALGQAWFGLLLVVAYGVGLALTLTAAGVAVVRLGGGVGRLLRRRPRWTSGPLAATLRRATPLGSACVVVALGAGLVFRGAASALG